MDESERARRWAETAVNDELDKIRRLPANTNIFKPGNPFWQSLFKIASIVNGDYKTPQAVFTEIEASCSHLSIPRKDLQYQWRRACQQAEPRRLKA